MLDGQIVERAVRDLAIDRIDLAADLAQAFNQPLVGGRPCVFLRPHGGGHAGVGLDHFGQRLAHQLANVADRIMAGGGGFQLLAQQVELDAKIVDQRHGGRGQATAPSGRPSGAVYLC